MIEKNLLEHIDLQCDRSPFVLDNSLFCSQFILRVKDIKGHENMHVIAFFSDSSKLELCGISSDSLTFPNSALIHLQIRLFLSHHTHSLRTWYPHAETDWTLWSQHTCAGLQQHTSSSPRWIHTWKRISGLFTHTPDYEVTQWHVVLPRGFASINTKTIDSRSGRAHTNGYFSICKCQEYISGQRKMSLLMQLSTEHRIHLQLWWSAVEGNVAPALGCVHYRPCVTEMGQSGFLGTHPRTTPQAQVWRIQSIWVQLWALKVQQVVPSVLKSPTSAVIILHKYRQPVKSFVWAHDVTHQLLCCDLWRKAALGCGGFELMVHELAHHHQRLWCV